MTRTPEEKEREIAKEAFFLQLEEERKKKAGTTIKGGIRNANAEMRKAAAAALADKYCSKDGAKPDLEALSKLEPVKYGRVRKEVADRIGTPVKFLDDEIKQRKIAGRPTGGRELRKDPPPWDEAVNGYTLLNDLSQAAASHLILPPGAADAIALWVVFTHAHEAFQISPILAATSPTPECGKTTLMKFLGSVVRRAVPASNLTAASTFRAVDKWSPTLLIDEADSFLKRNEELRGVLDSGHDRHSAFLLRTVGDDYEPQSFSTWAPKAIACIGKMHPTLMSRSITISLKRKLPGQEIDLLRPDRLARLEPLLRKASRWAIDNAAALEASDPELPALLQSRAADNWRPLIAIADLAGGIWCERGRRVATAFVAKDSDETSSVVLLGDVVGIFERCGAEALHSKTILDELLAMEDRPWTEWRGKGLTKNGLAAMLKPFDIVPKQVWVEGRNQRGYELDAIRTAFSPYQNARTLDALASKELRGKQSARTDEVLAFQKGGNPLQDNGSSTLAVESPKKGLNTDNDPFESLKDPSRKLQRKPL
jgi:putative DNA primase/helicase